MHDKNTWQEYMTRTQDKKGIPAILQKQYIWKCANQWWNQQWWKQLVVEPIMVETTSGGTNNGGNNRSGTNSGGNNQQWKAPVP